MTRHSAYLLVLGVFGLLVTGMVMLFSASAYARGTHGDVYYFLRPQAIWMGAGLVAAAVATFVDYRLWARSAWALYVVTALLLALCFVHGIGLRINGSWRWVRLGPIHFQPSELAKLATVVVLARWYSLPGDRNRRFLTGFVVPLALAALFMLLIVREEDLGSTLLIGGVTVAVMFVAGANLWFMSALALTIGGGILGLASKMGNRMARMTAFLDLEKYRDNFGLQQWEGLRAFASGGISGLGLGESREKRGFLPYAHTDFIFPIIGEELGLRVTLLVLVAFALVIVSGVLIARQARDRFGALLACGLTVTIALQAMVNVGVTTALLPNKGMPLPFISAGGSNLCLCLLFVGILLNIYRQGYATGGVPPSAETEKLRVRVTPRL